MKIKIDKDADALYLRLNESTVVETEEVAPTIVLDYDDTGQVVGVEILRLSARSSKIGSSTLKIEIT